MNSALKSNNIKYNLFVTYKPNDQICLNLLSVTKNAIQSE